MRRIIGIRLYHYIGTKIKFYKKPGLKKMIIKNRDFKDVHKGKRCFILGNGPSLQNVDFSLLEKEYTITVNMLPRDSRFPKLKTNYHVWADENFFMLHKDRPEDMAVLEIMKQVNTKGNKPVVFYKVSAKNMIKQFGLDKLINIHYYEEGCWNKWTSKNNIRFDEPVPYFSTVIHYCICLAVYMGFKEIYLLGCDCTGIINSIEGWINLDNSSMQNLQYGYEVNENDKKISQRSHMKCNIRDEFIGWAGLLDDYEKLSDYCKERGTKLLNATHPTILQSIERVSLEDIL